MLGAPSSLVTTGATGNAQMVYEPGGASNGRILHTTSLANPGNATVLWNDVNLSVITFTGSRTTTGAGQLIDVRIGEVAPVPESSAALLGLGAAAGLLLPRRRGAAGA